MTTLRDLNACNMESRIGSTIQKEWDKDPREAFWLVGQAHSHGTMPRRELMRITLLMIEDSVKVAPKESQDCISELWKWVNGDDSVDLVKVRDTARAVFATDAAAAVATYAAEDAAADAVATYAVAFAAAVALAFYKKIYSLVSCEDVCKYFPNMDKEKEIV
jgi:hypothetical protein